MFWFTTKLLRSQKATELKRGVRNRIRAMLKATALYSLGFCPLCAVRCRYFDRLRALVERVFEDTVAKGQISDPRVTLGSHRRVQP